jgi:hypothetical protein
MPTQDQQDFVSTYGPIAGDIAQATGLDPSLVLGQAALESGWGKSMTGNNPWGLSPGGKLATYPDVGTAAQAYVDLMKTPRYAGVAASSDPTDQAKALVAGGYNTANPAYASTLTNMTNIVKNQVGVPGADAPQIGAGNPVITSATVGGHTFNVNQDYAPNFAGFLNDLAATGYKINDVQGYNNRTIAGSPTMSYHASGAAIDVNPSDNPVNGKSSLPANVGDIAAKWGLGWGGAWTGGKTDPMHFSIAKEEGGSLDIPHLTPGQAVTFAKPGQTQMAAASPAAAPAADPDEAAGAALVHSLAGAPPKGTATAAATPADPDEAAGQALVHGIASQAETAAAATPPPPTTAQSVGNWIGDAATKAGAGIGRAAHDLTDAPAELLARGASAIGLTNALSGAGAPTPEQTAAADQAGRAAYEKQYGDSTIATAARIGAQIAGTLPLLASGGGVVGAAGDIAAAGAARALPALAPVAQGANALLQGTLTGTSTAGNVLARGSSLAASGALQGGAAGALLSGQSDDSLGSQVLRGAGAGAIAGPVAGALGAGAGAILGKAGGVDADIAQLAQLARDKYGIPVTAPQMSGNSLVRIADDQLSKLPFSGAGGVSAAAQTAWQKAVINEMGETATRATPAVMSRAATRIGGVFNDVAARTNVNVDNAMVNDLARIETEAGKAPLGAEGQAAIKSQIDNVVGAAAQGNGTLTGDAYQQLTRAGSPLQRAESAADPNVRYYAGQVRDALDGAFQRSAAPADQAALTQARAQYRAMKTIEDLAEKSPAGDLSPALLMGQVRNASSKFDGSTSGMAYTGGGNLGDLARIGQQFLKPPPNSGTADRMLVNSLLGGGAVAAAIHNPLSLAAVPAGLGAARLAGAYLHSGGLANRMIQSSLNPSVGPSRLAPIVSPAAAIGYNALRPSNAP